MAEIRPEEQQALSDIVIALIVAVRGIGITTRSMAQILDISVPQVNHLIWLQVDSKTKDINYNYIYQKWFHIDFEPVSDKLVRPKL